MNDEEQVAQTTTPAAPADAGETPVEKLEALGVRGIVRQLARDGQIIDVRCEMPQCYCLRGRRYFEPTSPRSPWSPTPDHYPRLKTHGGHLTPDNVRLAHRVCNQRDYRVPDSERRRGQRPVNQGQAPDQLLAVLNAVKYRYTKTRATSTDSVSYPILRFKDALAVTQIVIQRNSAAFAAGVGGPVAMAAACNCRMRSSAQLVYCSGRRHSRPSRVRVPLKGSSVS